MMFSTAEFVQNYEAIGSGKAKAPAHKLLLLGVLAGFFIGMGGVVTNLASHGLANPSVSKVLSGMLFPFGLIMVILSGSELFTGNCLMVIPLLSRKITLGGMIRNWVYVYLGNLIGSLLLAWAMVHSGQFAMSGGNLGLFTVKTALAKCSLPFGRALILGLLCNVLVCSAVMFAMRAKSVPGVAAGAFIPIAFFVISGFEHSVANMYYIPAGIMACRMPDFLSMASATGLDVTHLTCLDFLIRNLLPVTLGNILGGCGFGALVRMANK